MAQEVRAREECMHLYHPTQFMRYHKLLCIYLRAYTAPLAYPSFISTQICSLHLNLTPLALPAYFSTHDIASWLLLFQFEKLDCHADIQLGVWTAGGK